MLSAATRFASDGYCRAPIGPDYTHSGTRGLRSFFTRCFSAGGGIGLQHCAVTDDGVRCALECNCVRWGSHRRRMWCRLCVLIAPDRLNRPPPPPGLHGS
jgi:hypothetical protein